MISAEKFINLLVEKDLLPSDVVQSLRGQIAGSDKPVLAATVARRLIKTGYLTQSLAERLLQATAEIPPTVEELVAPVTPMRETKRKPKNDLGLTAAGAKKEVEEEPWGLEAVEPAAPTPLPVPPAAFVLPPPPSRLPVAKVIRGDANVMDAMPVEEDESLSAADWEGGSALKETARGPFRFFRGLAPRRDRRRKENIWDSPLLLVGGGALLLFLILGGALSWALLGQSGDKMAEQAETFYREGSYTKAIEQYNLFLQQFPTHEQASLARVRRGLCQLRQAAEVTGNYAKALEVANEVLGEIGKENAFGEAKTELEGILPKIAEGLAKEARQKADPAVVQQARESVALIEKYISRSHQPKVLMDDIEASLALADRAIARNAELDKAVTGMDAAINQHKSEEAYLIRKRLLKSYPDLAGNDRLHAAVLKASQAEKDAVKTVAKPQPAEKSEPAGPAAAGPTVAAREFRRETPGGKGHVIYALAEGAAYGLDAATGKVLWRRFVGYQANGRGLGVPPVPLDNKPGGDALLLDAAAGALLRVEATSGKLRWRHVIEGRIAAPPVVVDDRMLVAVESGRLVSMDSTTGDSPSFIQFPQSLGVAPAVDPQSSRIYQVAEHSNLYVLSADGKCESVVYLAHEPGSITAAPVLLGRFLVVCENRGADSVRLRVFSLGPEGQIAKAAAVQEIDIEGHIDASPLVSGATLLATTDRGWVTVFRLSGTNTVSPLEKIASLRAGDRQNLIRFPLLIRDQFWIAADGLSKHEIQSSLGNVRTLWTACPKSAFQQPVTAVDDALFLIRRRANLPGVFVSAMAMDKPETYWETALAAPPVGEPDLRGQPSQVELVTALGGVFDLPSAAMKESSVVDQPVVAPKMDEITRPIEHVLRAADGLMAFTSGAGTDQIIVLDRAATPQRLRRVVLLDGLAAPPTAFGGGLLAACQGGQVFLVDWQTGAYKVEPFQPKLAGGERLAWRQPVAVDENSVVLGDGKKMVYRLGIVDQPKSHLAALDQVELAKAMASPVAVVEGMVHVVDKAGQLQQLALPKLTPGKPIPLGMPVWGPRGVGRRVFVATEDEQLFAIEGGKIVWQIGLPYGPMAGPPLPLGDHYILVSTSGVVWRVNAASGKELAKIETGHPLAAGAVLLGEQLLLSGNDGALYLVKQP